MAASSSFLFDNIYIDTKYFGLFALIAAIVISVLNKTIKPIIFNLTIPITGLTLGTFYLVINFFILKITDWCLMSHFSLGNNIYAFFIAVFISLLNAIMESTILTPLIRRIEING